MPGHGGIRTKGARQKYLCKFILTFSLHVNVFIGRHFECWKRYILLAYRRRDNLCSSLTLIYVTRWFSEGRPRKIRNLKYGWEKIKNKEGSETAEHVMGYWPMTMHISNFVIWPCSLIKNCQILKFIKIWIDLHRCSPAVNFWQQRNKNICECWTQNTVLIIHEENSKEMNVQCL
jgi:hypothetical protein